MNKSFTRSDTMNSAFQGDDFAEKEKIDLYFEIQQTIADKSEPLILKRVDKANHQTEVWRSEPTQSKDYKFSKSFLTEFYFEKKQNFRVVFANES